MRLEHLNGHLFVQAPEGRFLLDTGAPQSFGSCGQVTLAGTTFPLAASFMGLDVEALEEHVATPMGGLLGADILNGFDIRLDLPNRAIEVSLEALSGDGVDAPLRFVMGVPILPAEMGGEACSLFFDTGAQISYWQSDRLTAFPAAGPMDDFYPGFGAFTTETFHVPVAIGGRTMRLRCGRLPDLLGLTLLSAGASGIVGIGFLEEGEVLYLPRRHCLRVMR